MILTELTILGNPRPKKNNMTFIRTKNGKTALIQTEQFQAYKESFILQCKLQYKKEPIGQGVNVKCIYYRGDKRKTDLVNLQNGTLDILVEAGVLKDDNWRIVQSMDGSRVFYDKDNPRVEITIETIKEEK